MRANASHLIAPVVALLFFTACPPGGAGSVDGGGVPPPQGFSQIAAHPGAGFEFGLHAVMVLDRNDYPSVAWVREPTSDRASATIQFSRWNGAEWIAPVTVATVGDIDSDSGMQQLSLARDRTDGRLGLAFAKVDEFCPGPNLETGIFITFSSDFGATWTTPQRISEVKYTRNDPVSGVPVCNTSSPRLAMRGGAVHLAWHADAGLLQPSGLSFWRGVYYAKQSAAGGAWAIQLAPELGATARVSAQRLAIAVDSADTPGLAYILRSDGSSEPYQNTVLFWRPGSGSAVRVADSGNTQNDLPQVALTFSQEKPRVAYHLLRAATVSELSLYVARSDDGVTFTEARVPGDGADRGATYMDADVFGGKTVVAYDFNAGGASSAGSCGGPKLASSTDLTTWTTACPDTQTRQFLAPYVTIDMTMGGKVTMVFNATSADDATPRRFDRGLVFWRE